MKINTTKWKCVWRLIRDRQHLNAFRLICNGRHNLDTYNGAPFWTVKKGIGYDYSNLRVVLSLPRQDDGWDTTPVIKPEGHPVKAELQESGAIEIGHWWSVQFRFYKLLVRYRYRSYAPNIFYITWGGF